MTSRRIAALVLSCSLAQAVVVDRIAIVAGKKIIKESDIVKDLRLTAFLNQEPLNCAAEARKKAASRLLDQQFIREEIESGDYPKATIAETQDTLDKLIKSRYRTAVAYKNALAVYGISEDELKARLLWQLTVLRFIDARFRSATYVSDDEIRQYYDAHPRQFGADLTAARTKIEDLLIGERTDKAFYEWLDQRRQATTIRYLEGDLK